MQEAVEQRGGHDRIAKDVPSFGKASVGSQDHGPSFVARVDELEEQIAAAGDDRQISDLVNDQQARPAEEANAFLQPGFPFGTGERCDQVGQRAKVDALAGFDGLDPERRGQVALAGSRRPEEVDGLVALDEAKLRQCEDAVLVERGLEAAIEARQGLDGGEPAHAQRGLDAAVLAQRQLFRQQDIDRLQGRQLSMLEAAHDLVEGLQRPRHLQSDKIVADAINHRGHDIE